MHQRTSCRPAQLKVRLRQALNERRRTVISQTGESVKMPRGDGNDKGYPSQWAVDTILYCAEAIDTDTVLSNDTQDHDECTLREEASSPPHPSFGLACQGQLVVQLP